MPAKQIKRPGLWAIILWGCAVLFADRLTDPRVRHSWHLVSATCLLLYALWLAITLTLQWKRNRQMMNEGME